MLLRKICLLAFSRLAELLFDRRLSAGELKIPFLSLAHRLWQVAVWRKEEWSGTPHRHRRKWILLALNSWPPFLSKLRKKATLKPYNLDCAIWCECMNSHALTGRRQNDIISEGICRNKMQQFSDSDWIWKCLKGWSGFFFFTFFTKIYRKSLSKTF